MKNNRIKQLFLSASLVTFCFTLSAKENEGTLVKKPTTSADDRSMMANCSPATAQIDLDINNVRAKLFTGGDMWWDLINNPRYYVPKPKDNEIGPSSLFAGSLWIGGYDKSNNLKVAAQTYRQSGNDYWPGPLSSAATIDAATCLAWDKFYKINKTDVITYTTWLANGSPGNNPLSSTVMDVINNWPVLGPEGQSLAPYYDANKNGSYDPENGDYPDFDVDKTRGCSAQLFGDQCIYWIFNDKGNTHTETGGTSIGLEVQAQAFAFQTSDEINNMTFYKYKIINKSSFSLDSTYFGVWDDADLGYYKDDFVGCDVGLGLGMLFNGFAIDGSGQITAYGANPPAVGVDFFEGPYADPDNTDNPASSQPPSFLNYGDGIVDNERLGMGRFIYYNNDFTVTGNPSLATHYYQYLTGTWKDATQFTYGGNAHLTSGPICKYVFPGPSDPLGYGTNMNPQAPWDETSSGNTPADRRFLESAGPFTLQPGAVNVITVGVPWARATQGGNLASVALLKGADAKAQQLFNNCFSTIDGPTAPNLAIQELDKEIILTWSNPKTSNNFEERYSEDYDKSTGADSLYRFQGYQVFQLKDGNVSQQDLNNIDKARPVFQCDVKDGITQIVNYKNDQLLSALVPTEMVKGEDKGILHSVSLTEDKFATGDKRLINHKTYYYAIIAYAYSPTQLPSNLNQLVDYNPYVAGRFFSDFGKFTPRPAIPHIPSPEAGGTEQHSVYGSGPKLTRIEGRGNGGRVLDITAKTEAAIVASPTGQVAYPVYENGRGPIDIKVVDPLNVSAGKFRFTMYNTSSNVIYDTTKWFLTNLTTGEIVSSETNIKLPNEQLINGQPTGVASKEFVARWGISVNATFTFDPGPSSINPSTPPTGIYPPGLNNGFIEATMTFADNTKQWLSGVADAEGPSTNNWIRSGVTTSPASANPQFDDYYGTIDDNGSYEKVLGGTWAPYRLAASTSTSTVGAAYRGGPAWFSPFVNTNNKIKNLASVDVVITNDKSKWTRCPVLEMQEEAVLAIGNAPKLHMRRSPSVDKNGRNSGDAGYNSAEGDLNGTTGMGWFPGYAINLETGERLNMAFGEDSWLANENGADMQWNPTGTRYNANGFGGPVFGGKHYIYVFGHNGDATYPGNDALLPNKLSDVPVYDQGKVIHDMLINAGTLNSDKYKKEVFTDAMWVNIPILAPYHNLRECDVKIRLRVTKPFQKYGTGTPVAANTPLTPGEKYIVMNGTIMYNGKTYYTNYATPCNTSILTGTTQPVSFTAVSPAQAYTIVSSGCGASNPAVPLVLTSVNGGDPLYDFNTLDIETHKGDAMSAKDALALINIVPNPYYAYSSYEEQALDNIVKITNLPATCTISIYTLNGTLIRRLKKADGDASASVNWDLQNQARIPIASGLYIIHVDVPGVGERILKWFGVMRPQDLDAY